MPVAILPFLFMLLPVMVAAAQAPEGIPRSLARARAHRIRDVGYRLDYTITPRADSVSAHEELRFLRIDAGGRTGEWLDFREGTVSRLLVNGRSAPPAIENGNLALPAALLRSGENEVEIDFMAPVAPAGKALTRFEDGDDGSEYTYTLFVPMDAELAFPCFDQPDLKARFRLSVTVPSSWTVISNTPGETAAPAQPGTSPQRRIQFAETRPISTYLFAFAAGPFVKVHDTPGLPGLYVRGSRAHEAEGEAPEVQQITADGTRFLVQYFAQPFPFPKYDLVLIPGFAYGGMEHAGTTFVWEEAVLFRTAPTHSDRLNRDLLLLHELTHQWFGNLVTMRWFDDLWLKEAFAQYMASHTLDYLRPAEDTWRRFYLAHKPPAYAIDSTRGTTPIYQEVANLKDAKSAYGAIVYSKAPAVMKQHTFLIGGTAFRDGLRLYLEEHLYGNAEWKDLVRAWERVSQRSLAAWAEAWIRRRAMPQVDVQWSCEEGHLVHVVLTRHDVLDGGGVWPIATRLLCSKGSKSLVERVEWGTERKGIALAMDGSPDYVFANYGDEAYGRFLLDPVSHRAVIAGLAEAQDLFQRTLLWGSLWDSVRAAETDPREYIERALRLLPGEEDEPLARSIIGHTITALHRYVSTETREKLVPRMETLAADRMLQAPSPDMRIVWFRALRSAAETPAARGRLKKVLSGELQVPGVALRPLDRWNSVAALVALSDEDADEVLAEEETRDLSGTFVAQAARPRTETKQRYFDDYLHGVSLPEDWVEESLPSFNSWNQSELTLPFLRPALDALSEVKRHRKIFFLLAWLNAFIGGQLSSAAQKEVYDFLETSTVDPDLRLKVLEVGDELDRTVRIRSRFP